MKDKYEISIWNHINFFIFHELFRSFDQQEEDITVSELLKRVEAQIGASKPLKSFYEFVNPGNVFSLLYSNLVDPKEMFENEDFGRKYFDKFQIEIEEFFVFAIGEEFKDDKFEFIRKIRNSVAHVNFEWEDNRRTIKLWNNYKGRKNFEVITDLSKLANFAIRISEFISKNQTQLKFIK